MYIFINSTFLSQSIATNKPHHQQHSKSQTYALYENIIVTEITFGKLFVSTAHHTHYSPVV